MEMFCILLTNQAKAQLERAAVWFMLSGSDEGTVPPIKLVSYLVSQSVSICTLHVHCCIVLSISLHKFVLYITVTRFHLCHQFLAVYPS